MSRLRSETAQAMVLTVLFMTMLVGFAGIAVDIGSWYREHRQAQSTADAAAVSGAQALPGDPTTAKALAQSYADRNGGGVIPGGVTVKTTLTPNDTVVVQVHRTAPGFLSRLFGIDSTTVGATASARTGVPSQVMGIAPIVVNKLHPDLSGPGCPCFNSETTLPLSKVGAPGGFDLINLDASGPNVGETVVAGWVQNGYPDFLGLGEYFQETGAKFSGNQLSTALQARVGTDLLFPVYDTLVGSGSNAKYHVVAWVAFHLDGVIKNKGNDFTLTGYFKSVIWNGIQSPTDPHIPDFGVHTVSIVS